MQKINVFIYAYKNKKLKQVVDAVINNTVNDVEITLVDQIALDRVDMFKEYHNVRYQHVPWDHQYGIGYFQKQFLESVSSGYVLMLSDDVILSKDWDIDLIKYINGRSIVLSGNGTVTLSYKDLFSFEKKTDASENFCNTGWIDRSFVFARQDLFKIPGYPDSLKYYGYEELFSLELFKNGIDVYSVPDKTYVDSRDRNLERYYSPFSLEHNYNVMVDILYPEGTADKRLSEFLEMHKITDRLYKLPYQTNDVDYDPNMLGVVSATSNIQRQRFTNNAKEIS